MPTVHDLVSLLWNVARYGIWTSCRHHVLDRIDVRSALAGVYGGLMFKSP